MSTQPTQTATQRSTTSSLFRSGRGKAPGRTLTSATIAADIAAFKKRGGRIEILGVTPYRAHVSSAFRSRANTQGKAAAASGKAAAKG